LNVADNSTSIDDVVTVLMVAEKPSIARSIAEALGGSGFATRKGICKFTNVFTFQGALFGKVIYSTHFFHGLKCSSGDLIIRLNNALESPCLLSMRGRLIDLNFKLKN